MFNKGDKVYVLLSASNEAVDYTMGDIRGRIFTIMGVDPNSYLDVLIDLDEGWWINSSAISLDKEDNSKTPVERKIAFMYKRWEKRHV